MQLAACSGHVCGILIAQNLTQPCAGQRFAGWLTKGEISNLTHAHSTIRERPRILPILFHLRLNVLRELVQSEA